MKIGPIATQEVSFNELPKNYSLVCKNKYTQVKALEFTGTRVKIYDEFLNQIIRETGGIVERRDDSRKIVTVDSPAEFFRAFLTAYPSYKEHAWSIQHSKSN